MIVSIPGKNIIWKSYSTVFLNGYYCDGPFFGDQVTFGIHFDFDFSHT